MREHRERRGFLQPGIERAVKPLDDARNGADPIVQAGEDGLLPPFAVHDVGLDHALRRLDAAAMGGQEHLVVPLHQPFQRADELRHVAFRRGDRRGVPAHHMIAGEHRALADQRKAEMVGCVARHMQHVERETLALTVSPSASLRSGTKAASTKASPRPGAPAPRACAGRPERGDLAAEQRLQGARAVAMVAMAVRDEDVRQPLAV